MRKSANKTEEKGFNCFKKATKETSQRYLDAAIESYIGELHRFSSKSLKKILVKEFILVMLQAMNAALQKDEHFSQEFFKYFVYRFSFQNYRTAILEDNFYSEHLQ